MPEAGKPHVWREKAESVALCSAGPRSWQEPACLGAARLEEGCRGSSALMPTDPMPADKSLEQIVPGWCQVAASQFLFLHTPCSLRDCGLCMRLPKLQHAAPGCREAFHHSQPHQANSPLTHGCTLPWFSKDHLSTKTLHKNKLTIWQGKLIFLL